MAAQHKRNKAAMDISFNLTGDEPRATGDLSREFSVFFIIGGHLFSFARQQVTAMIGRLFLKK